MMWAISILIVLVTAEILCLLGIAIIRLHPGIYYCPKNRPSLSRSSIAFYHNLLAKKGIGSALELHPELGWTLRPGLHNPDGTMQSTTGGARNDREYSRVPHPGTKRIATFGDCLTYGKEVSIRETWQAAMERLDPACEVLNFGTEAYGPDQSYLRYIESLKSYAGYDIVIFSIVATNVFKPLNTFRLFYAYDHGLPFGKPGFTLDDCALRRIPNPLPRLDDYERLLQHPTETLKHIGREDYYFNKKYSESHGDKTASIRLLKILLNEWNRYREVFDSNGVIRNDSDAFRVSIALFAECNATAIRNGSLPVFLFLPTRNDALRHHRSGVKSYQTILDRFAGNGYRYIDILEQFGAVRRPELHSYFGQSHFSGNGNRKIAEIITQHLKSFK